MQTGATGDPKRPIPQPIVQFSSIIAAIAHIAACGASGAASPDAANADGSSSNGPDASSLATLDSSPSGVGGSRDGSLRPASDGGTDTVEGSPDATSIADAEATRVPADAREVGATDGPQAEGDGATEACARGNPLAFPGAVGFGASATGGRGSAAYHVTSLDDSGSGSLRDAVSESHRIVVFDVGGIINLASPLSVSSDLTIAGQTAPGGGVAVEGREVSFSNSSNVIVRHVRFRQGTNDPDTGKSVIAADSSTSLIFDHVSVEFGQWDNMDINGGSDVTIQASIIADPIGQQFNAHCTSGSLTWYENVFSSAHNRSPLAKGDTQFIDNVVYNFQAGYTAGDSSGTFLHDIVDNYFIVGPSTTSPGDAFFQMANQSVYTSGNELKSTAGGSLSGSAMGLPGGATALAEPWASTTTALATADAAAAYADDVAHCGALPRDDVDTLVVADVTSLGTLGHLWTTQTATGLPNAGYGTLAGGTAALDSDGDGIPDTWETANGLNPNDASDASRIDPCTGYAYVEEYINSLADALL